jgi:hypothetical protein
MSVGLFEGLGRALTLHCFRLFIGGFYERDCITPQTKSC